MASDWDSCNLQHIDDKIDMLTQSITEIENQLRKRGDNLMTDDWLQNDLQYHRDKLSSLQEILADKQSKLKSGELKEITFPGADEEALSHLLSAGSVASFGERH